MPSFSSGTRLNYWYCHSVSDSDLIAKLDGLVYIKEIHLASTNHSLKLLDYLGELQIEKVYYEKGTTEDLTDFVLPASLTSLQYSSSTSTSTWTFTNVSSSWLSSEGTNLTTLKIYHTNLDNVSFLNGLTALTTIDLGYNTIQSLEGVTSSLSSVTSLDLTANNITGLKGIENFTALQTLTLTGNTALSDTAGYTDSDGNTVTYNNLELLASMNTANGGSLAYLYLEGCTGIVDFTPVSSLSWSGKSGF